MARSNTLFQLGNLAAVKSGSRSVQMSMNKAAIDEEIRGLLSEHLDYLAPQDPPVLDQAVDVGHEAATAVRLPRAAGWLAGDVA